MPIRGERSSISFSMTSGSSALGMLDGTSDTSCDGTFTMKAQITETLTSDPNVLTDNGRWAIAAGTGAYAKLHGQRTVVGTVDENVNLITRTFQGQVHFG